MEGWRQCSSSDGLGWLRAGLPSKKQQTIGPTFLSSGMVPERSSPSRVRCAAQNAPLTAPGRSEKPAAKKGRWNFRKANLTATGLLMEGDYISNPDSGSQRRIYKRSSSIIIRMCRLPRSTALTCPCSNWLVAPNTAFEDGHYGRRYRAPFAARSARAAACPA